MLPESLSLPGVPPLPLPLLAPPVENLSCEAQIGTHFPVVKPPTKLTPHSFWIYLSRGLLVCSVWPYDVGGLFLIPFLSVQTLNPTHLVLFQSNC